MSKVSNVLLFFATSLVCMISSCTDPTTLGSDLLTQENVEFTDTMTLFMATVKEDSIRTYDPDASITYINNMVGNYSDPEFGHVRASIFSQLNLGPPSVPDDFTEAATLDSIFFLLDYNSGGIYGDTNQIYSVSVYRMTEPMAIEAFYDSRDSFTYDETTLLGSLDFTPRPSDSILLANPTKADTVFKIKNHLRIPLSNDFGNELLSLNKDTLNNYTSFLNYLDGIHIKSTSENDGILSFSMISNLSGIEIFYSVDDTVNTNTVKSVKFLTNNQATRTNFINHTYPTHISEAFGDESIGDSILYLQGLSGPNIAVRIPYLDHLKGQIINKAVLEFTVASEMDDLRETPPQVIVATKNSDDAFLVIDDVAFTLGRTNFSSVFGGAPVEENGITTYKFNIAGHLQGMIDNGNEILYLRVISKQDQAARMTLFGPKHSQYPAKLNLIYTVLED